MENDHAYWSVGILNSAQPLSIWRHLYTKYIKLGRFLVIFALAAVFLNGCKKDRNTVGNFILNDTLTIKKGEVLINYDYDISICLDSVLNDSRCPLTYECIWAGNAELRFTFNTNDINTIFKLNTAHYQSFKSDTLIKGYRITLIGLSPYPQSSEIISQNDYRAEIIIKKE
jgi:hypothetical protein